MPTNKMKLLPYVVLLTIFIGAAIPIDNENVRGFRALIIFGFGEFFLFHSNFYEI